MDPTKTAKNQKPWGRYALTYKQGSHVVMTEEGYTNPASSVRPFSNYQSKSKEHIAASSKLQGRPWSRGNPNFHLRSKDGFSFGEYPNHRSQENIDIEFMESSPDVNQRPKSSYMTNNRNKEEHLRRRLKGKGVDQYLKVLAWKDSKLPIKLKVRPGKSSHEQDSNRLSRTANFKSNFSQQSTQQKRSNTGQGGTRSGSGSQTKTNARSNSGAPRMRMERECCKSKRQLLDKSNSRGKKSLTRINKFTSTSGLLTKIEPSEIDEQRNSVLVRSQPTLVEAGREKDTQTSAQNLATLPLEFGRYTGQFFIKPSGVIVKGVRTGDGMSDGNDDTQSAAQPLTPKHYSDKNIGTSRVAINSDRPDSPVFGDQKNRKLLPSFQSSHTDEMVIIRHVADPYKDYQIDEVLPSNDTDMNMVMISRSDKSDHSIRPYVVASKKKTPAQSPKEVHTFRGKLSDVKDIRVSVKNLADNSDQEQNDRRSPMNEPRPTEMGQTEVEFQLTKVDPFDDVLDYTPLQTSDHNHDGNSPFPYSPLPQAEPQRMPVSRCVLCSNISQIPKAILETPLICRPPTSPSRGKSKSMPREGIRAVRNLIKTREGVYDGLVTEPISMPDKKSLSNKDINRIAFISRTNPEQVTGESATLSEVYKMIRHRGFKSIDGKCVNTTPRYPDLQILVQGIATYVANKIQAGKQKEEFEEIFREGSLEGGIQTPSRHPSRFSGLNSRNTLISQVESQKKQRMPANMQKLNLEEPLLSRLEREKVHLDQEIKREMIVQRLQKVLPQGSKHGKVVPSPPLVFQEIADFVENVITVGKLPKQVAVIGVVFLERILTDTGTSLQEHNFKGLMIACWMVSSKVWDDEGYETEDFSAIFPAFDRTMLNRLEGWVLDALDFDTSVSLSLYTSTYFSLLSQASPDSALAQWDSSTVTMHRNLEQLQLFNRMLGVAGKKQHTHRDLSVLQAKRADLVQKVSQACHPRQPGIHRLPRAQCYNKLEIQLEARALRRDNSWTNQ